MNIMPSGTANAEIINIAVLGRGAGSTIMNITVLECGAGGLENTPSPLQHRKLFGNLIEIELAEFCRQLADNELKTGNHKRFVKKSRQHQKEPPAMAATKTAAL
ncbi:MAG: hypothetical protein ACOX75_00270 [Lachnospiraceae bacterium]|jgi:hypothetical protein